MPWKLGDPHEPTVKIDIRLPLSMKRWLQARPEGAARAIRLMVAARMSAEQSKKRSD